MQKSKSIALMMMLASPSLHAQETSSETVVVTGSRLPYTEPGPIDAGPGPVKEMPCAEPNCGQPPEDPAGGSVTTQQQKNAENKRNQEKAKSDGRLKEAIRATNNLLAAVKKWFASKGIDIGIGVETYERTYYENGGVKNEKGWCASAHGSYGAPNPNYKDPCVEVDAQPEVVKKADGVLENQVRLHYTVYDLCYFDKTCGPKHYSFIAGTPEELDWMMNPLAQ